MFYFIIKIVISKWVIQIFKICLFLDAFFIVWIELYWLIFCLLINYTINFYFNYRNLYVSRKLLFCFDCNRTVCSVLIRIHVLLRRASVSACLQSTSSLPRRILGCHVISSLKVSVFHSLFSSHKYFIINIIKLGCNWNHSIQSQLFFIPILSLRYNFVIITPDRFSALTSLSSLAVFGLFCCFNVTFSRCAP